MANETDVGEARLLKSAEARATPARRISDMDVDILAVQEVEDVKTLEEFARSAALVNQGYKHIVLVEGNDADRQSSSGRV